MLNLGTALGNVADIYVHHHDVKNALYALHQVVAIVNDDDTLGRAMVQISILHYEQGSNVDVAYDMACKAYQIFAQQNSDHNLLFNILYMMASIRMDQGRLDEAWNLYVQYVETTRQAYEERDLHVALTKHAKGKICMLRGDLKTAIGFLQDSSNDFQRLGLAADDDNVISAFCDQARCWEMLGDHSSSRLLQMKCWLVLCPGIEI